MAGRLLQSHPGPVHADHVAENRDEVRWVRELFPEARSYLDVYAPRRSARTAQPCSHDIWLDDEDRALLRQRGAQIAHTVVNLFLGSGPDRLARGGAGGRRRDPQPATSAADQPVDAAHDGRRVQGPGARRSGA